MHGLQDLILASGSIVGVLIKIAVAAALLVFIWGLATFIFQSGDPRNHEAGRNRMVWGIVALFVMTSIWGIVSFMQRDLGLSGYNAQNNQNQDGDLGPCDGSSDNPCL